MLHPAFAKRLRGYIQWLVRRPELRSEPLVFLSRCIRWKVLTLTHEKPTVLFADDIRMTSPRRNVTASATYQLGYAEPHLFRFLSLYLKEGMHFCDVGANVGAYTLFAAKKVGPRGRVFSFEAAPEIYKYLLENIAANGFGNVDANNLAVGPHPGTIVLCYNPKDIGKSHVCVNPGGDPENHIEIDMVALDQYLASSDMTRLDYLKIDVEGFELAVLQGAHKTIANNCQMIIQTEVLPALARRYGCDGTQVFHVLRSFGFAPYSVDHCGSMLYSVDWSRELAGDLIWIHGANEATIRKFVGHKQ
jgi:FkbM family methyltransferase